MATFIHFDEFLGELGKATHNLSTNTLKMALTNSAPTADTYDELADVTQIANGNGYTTGGTTLTTVTWVETGAGTGIWRLSSDDVVFTASGGSIAAFRYGVLYNDTSTNDKLIGYLDYGSSVTITVGNTFTFDVNATNGYTQLSEV